MWISESDIAHGWQNVKSIVGQAWHQGRHLLQGVDRAVNLGTRLLGAAGETGLLQGKALEASNRAVDSYSRVREKARGLEERVQGTVSRFKQRAPELGL